MKNWSKDLALGQLKKIFEEISELKQEKRYSANHIRWVQNTRIFVEDIFGKESEYYKNFTYLSWTHRGQAIIGGPNRPRESMNPQLGIDRINQEAYLCDLEVAKGLLLSAQDLLRDKDINEVYEGKNTPVETSELVKLIKITESKLRKVIRHKPNNEKEVQDAYETLLIGADISYSRESENIEYSSKTYIPDFTMPKINLAVDIKICNRIDREKEIIAELNDDILAYKKKYGNLFFVIYDVGFIRDIDKLSQQFEEIEGVIVRIIKH